MNIKVHGCVDVHEKELHVLRVSYSTDDDDDLEYDLPLVLQVDPTGEEPPEWTVPQAKTLSDFENKLWDAVGDAAVVEAERRAEGD